MQNLPRAWGAALHASAKLPCWPGNHGAPLSGPARLPSSRAHIICGANLPCTTFRVRARWGPYCVR
eukprot:6546059-Pyramimonas_sp.AAC.1